MSCVAAIIDKDKTIWMGCDSLCSGTYNITLTSPKIVTKRSDDGMLWMFGVCGSLRIFDILDSMGSPPPIPKKQDLQRYIRSCLIPEFQKALRNAAIIQKKDGMETMNSTTILLGVSGRLFIINENLAVIEQVEKYAAVGSSTGLALGSLHTTEKLKWNPKKRLTIALEAAGCFDGSVRGPFHILKIKNPAK